MGIEEDEVENSGSQVSVSMDDVHIHRPSSAGETGRAESSIGFFPLRPLGGGFGFRGGSRFLSSFPRG